MPFKNPIIGQGDTLVRQAMQSDGFSLDAESNVSGWRIQRDGSSYFTNVTIGNVNYTVDASGNAAFNALTVNDSDITVGGQALISDVISPLPTGIFALNLMPNDTAAYASTPVLFGKIVLPVIDPTRQYKVCAIGRINAAGSPAYIRITCYVAINRDATTADSLLFEHQEGARTTSNYDWAFNVTHCFNNTTSPGDAMHFSFFFDASPGSTPNYQGTNYGRIWLEDAGLAVPYGTFDPGTSTTPPQQYTKTYNATWSRAWDDQGASVHSTNGELVQGYYSGYGQRLSWIGFPFSTIQSDLSGATVNKVEVYLYYDHWYYNSGGTAIIGYHSSTATSAPSYNSSLDNLDEKEVTGWGVNVGKWVDITSSGAFTASGWKTGAHTGIVIGYGPTTNLIYYGKARGYSESNAPKLRITYTK